MSLRHIEWESLFFKANFFALKKEKALDPEIFELQSKIIFTPNLLNFHPVRQEEFIKGRLCAYKAYKATTGLDLLELVNHQDRSPLWPAGVVGSISHNHHWVGAAVAKSDAILGIGIDFEEMGRTRAELQKYITTAKDIKDHPHLNETELLTVIFSAKESLYKALYPTVKKFFGFEDAAVIEIDVYKGVFIIELLRHLSDDFGPKARHIFSGQFAVTGETLLTVLEIPHLVK